MDRPNLNDPRERQYHEKHNNESNESPPGRPVSPSSGTNDESSHHGQTQNQGQGLPSPQTQQSHLMMNARRAPLPSDVEHINEVEWASAKSPSEYAPRPRMSPPGDPCGCTAHYDETTDTIDTSTPCCADMSCVLFACQEECRSNCEAGELCANRRISKRQWKNVEVIDAGVKGRGLRISTEPDQNGHPPQPIKSMDFIIEYTGVAIKKDYLDAMFRRYRMERMLYIMALTNDVYIDARKKGGVARYINHSCDPNCAVHRWKVRGIIRAGIFALKYIALGEELSFDYKWKRKRGRAPTKCYCGSPNCRGTLEDMLDKSEEEEQEEMKLQGHWKMPSIVKGVGSEIMNRTIKVFQKEEDEYFLADVCKYDPIARRHCLIYRGEVEETWEALDDRKWMILDEEMEQFVILRKRKYLDEAAMGIANQEVQQGDDQYANQNQNQKQERLSPVPIKVKNYVIVQTPMKEQIFAKHLVDRCQRHHRVQISVIQQFEVTATDPDEAAADAKALEESQDGVTWKFTVEGMQPAKACEYLEKNIEDFQNATSGGDEEMEPVIKITRHEIVIPRCVVDYVKNRMPLLRNNCKNAEITFTASKSMSKQFAKLIIESEDDVAAFDAQHLLWKEVLTLCNHHDAPRTPKGLFKDLAFYGGELTTEHFNLLCPKLSKSNISQDCCENLRESAGMAAFEDFYRCTIWVQAMEDMGRINSNNRLVTDAFSGKRKIFFGSEPRRIPELWGHIIMRISEIKAGVKFVNMDMDKEHLPFISRVFENRPRGMAASFFDYLKRVTGASVRTDTFNQHCIRVDGTEGIPFGQRAIHLDGLEDSVAIHRKGTAEELIRLQMELMRDSRIRQHRWCFGRDWSLHVTEEPNNEVDGAQEKEAALLSPRPSVTRPSNKRYIANACMEISDITEVLNLDGSIAAHACVILYRYLNQVEENMSQSKQRDILLACLFLASKAQKECKWKRLEIILDATYKIFYAGAKFNPDGNEGAAWEKRILAMEEEILKSLEYDIFWGGIDWITTIATESGQMAEKVVKEVMELTLTGPVFASGPSIWLKLGPEYAFTAMAALLSLDIKHLFSTLSLNPLKLNDAVDLITTSILTNRASRQKGSKISHDIFKGRSDTFAKLKVAIKDICTTQMAATKIVGNHGDLTGQAKQYQIISRRCGRRRVFKGVESTLLDNHLLPAFRKVQDKCLCDMYVEEGAGYGHEHIIIEGSWRSLALAEDMFKNIAKAANYVMLDAEDTEAAPRDSSKSQGRSQPGLLPIKAFCVADDWSSMSECGWTTKIGGKTCLPGKVKKEAIHECGLRWWLRPTYCPNMKGSLCDIYQVRKSYIEDVNTVHHTELAKIANAIDLSATNKHFPLLTNDLPIDLVNDKSKEFAAVSLQRWPPEKTEQREQSKGGMGVGISPAALQEMQILTKLHSVIPGPQGHPNFILPIAIAIDENKEPPKAKEPKKKKKKLDLMSGTSDDLLLSLTTNSSTIIKEKDKEVMGSHLVFQPTPIILQRVMNKNKRRKGGPEANFVIPPSLITAWFHDLLSAMAHCHTNHIVLRTLHPDQIFIDNNGVARISGLTRSIVLHPTDRDRYLDPLSSSKNKKKSTSITDDDISSNLYMAPELLLGATRYTPETDIWTLAALMAHLMIGKPIVSGRDRKSKTRAIFKIVGTPSSSNYKEAQSYPHFNICRTDKKYKSGVDKALRYMFRDGGRENADHYSGILTLLERMLVLDPRKRMSAMDALEHPSMTEFVSWTMEDVYRTKFVDDWNSLKESLCSEAPTEAKANGNGLSSMNVNGIDLGAFSMNMSGSSSFPFKRSASYLNTNLGKADDDGLYDLDDIIAGSKRSKVDNKN